MLFDKEAITVIGGLIGGIYGFIIARMAAAKIATKDTYQPVVLKINLPEFRVTARRIGRPTNERR